MARSSEIIKVSVIIPAWNGRPYLAACLDALLAQEYPDTEVIVVDNASVDGSAELVAESYASIRLIRNQRNLGFAGGCNAGLRVAQGNLLVLLNQDAVPQPGWLQAIAKALDDPQIGVVGCKILEADGVTLNHCGGLLDMDAVQAQHRGSGEADRGQYNEAVDVAYVTGAAFALRRDVLHRVGWMDELFFPGYYEDADYCVRTREAGYRIRYVPDAVVIHHVSASTGQDWIRRQFYEYRNRLLFALKHLSPQKLAVQFVPFERERLYALAPGKLWAAQIALAEILARWTYQAEEIQPHISPQAVGQVSYGLRSLLDFVKWRRGRDLDPTPIVPALNKGRSQQEGAIGALLSLVGDMESAWRVRAPSPAPRPGFAGSLMALGRAVWRLFAIAGYRTLLRKQFKFNHLIQRTVCALAAQLWDSDSTVALLSEQYEMMVARTTEFEARLAQMEEKRGVEKDRHG